MTDKSGMLAAVAQAAGLDASAPVNLTAALVAQHFPAVAAEFKAEGAKAERLRIEGIEAQAMKGHETIIAAMKADGTKTGADAAMAIVAAEKAQRANMLAGLAADEQRVKGLRAEPANGFTPAAEAAAEPASDDWKAAGFTSKESFEAMKRADERGAVKLAGPTARTKG